MVGKHLTWMRMTILDFYLNWQSMDPQSFKIFSETAYCCLKVPREERPNINQIVARLQKASEIQLKTENLWLETEISQLLNIRSASSGRYYKCAFQIYLFSFEKVIRREDLLSYSIYYHM